MKNSYILVLDSGNGGEYTLNEIKKILPNENFIMFKDTRNSPYGNKNKRKLLTLTINNIESILQNYNIKLVVIACNTLSTTILNELKEYFNNICFVGVFPSVEEAVNSNKETLVLSTKSTLKLGKIDKNHKNNPKIRFYAFKHLAKMIDEHMNNLDYLLPYLNKKLRKYKNVKNVVLGCTHYNYIKPQLKKVLNNDIVFYENSFFTAKKVERLLKALSLKSKSKKKGFVIKLTKI